MFDLHVKGKDGERYLLRPGFGTSTPTSGGPSAAEANRLLHSFDAKTLQAIYQHFFGLGRAIDPFVEQKAFPQGNGVSRPPSSPIAQHEDVNLYAARYQFGDGINKPLFLAFISKRIVVDPAPLSNYENEELGGNLKVKIRQALREIINQEKLEAAQIDEEYQKRTRLGKVWAHGKAAGEGLGEAAWGLAVWVKDVGEVAFYTSPIRQAYLTASHAIEAGELSKDVWAESHKEFLTGAKKELVDVLGFDPSTITMDQLYTAFDVAELVYSDDSVRNIFYRFTKDYAAAQHSTEIAEFAGGGVFEIILTVILAVFTGGAGAVASMAGKARHMKHFAKVGDLVMEYAKVLKRRKQILEENNGKSNKGDLSDLVTNESVYVAKNPSVKSNTSYESRHKQIDDLKERKVRPSSLEDARNILASRRAQIQESGYQPKYSDQELALLASKGNVGSERYQVRFMEERYMQDPKTPDEVMSGKLGMVMETENGRGAKYWSTSFDQLEDADSDPKIISEKLGLNYDPKKQYALVIIDTKKSTPLSGVKSVPATFEHLGEFANAELPSDFPKGFTQKVMNPEFQAKYAEHYNAAVEQKFLEGPWSRNTKGFKKYLNTTDMNQSDIETMVKRMEMHDVIGNNQDYLGNGLTKDINPNSTNEYGAVETFNFERKEVNLKQLDAAGAITVIGGLSPI